MGKIKNNNSIKEKNTIKYIFKSNRAITLVALIITIIILIILAGVAISLLFGEDNIIDKTKQAKYVSQFSEVEEKVLLYMSNKKMEEVVQNLNLTQEEKLPLGDIADKNTFKDTLKEEIEQTSGESLENVNLYYIDKEKINTKVDHTYIIDIENVQIYDADGEYFLGKWHHTLRQLNIQGKPDVVDDIPTITIEGDIGWYAPNVDGFNGSHSYLVYYNISNYEDKKEVAIKEYIEGGKKNKIEENGTTYVLDNYKDKQWANIKLNANELESWWVWIPRYAYVIDSANKKTDIIFIDLNNKPIGSKYETLPENYIVHPGFTKTKVNEKGETIILKQLQGIWMSKYEPSSKLNSDHNLDSGMCYEPDLNGFDLEHTYIELIDKETKNFNEEKLVKNTDLKTVNNDNRWYDYSKKAWANVKTNANGLECWWVWIPRYAYCINQGVGEMDIIFIDLNNKPIDTVNCGNTLPDNFIVHPAFTVTNSNGTVRELKGIWMSKYEPSNQTNNNYNMDTGKCYEPDLSGFDKNYTYIELYNAETKTFDEQILAKDANLNTINNNGKWYNYNSKIWANIKTNANGLECWWVWIPRYAYCINTASQEADVIFVDLDNKPIDKERYGDNLPDNFIVHPAFTVTNSGGTVRELKGIWMSKYEPSNVADVISGTVATGASTLPKATDQAGTSHTHLSNGCGTKERFVTSSTKWCTAYDGTPCSNYGYYIYCSECGVRMRHYWCKNHVNKATKVIINDDNVE